MSEEYDPYHKLLGIAPREQPPNHYRLLGLDTFEDDPEVIEASANRQMAYLQGLASGPVVEHVQQLLNEISQVRLCLLDQKQKTAYDAELRDRRETDTFSGETGSGETGSTAASKPPVQQLEDEQKVSHPPAAPAPPRTAQFDFSEARPAESAAGPPRPRSTPAVLVAGVAVVCLALVAVVAVAITGNTSSDTNLLAAAGGGDPDSRREYRSGDDAGARDLKGQRGGQRGENTKSKSDMPAPGDYVKNVRAENDREVSEFQPPELPEMPKQVKAARAALVEGDLQLVIELLEDYLADAPQPPWQGVADQILGDATFVTSDKKVSQYLAAKLKQMTDDEIAEIANGADFFEFSRRETFPLPILEETFLQAVDRNLPDALLDRLEQ
ncbi:MAG: hypothetical protein VX988_01435 [Planctomycetota bacterium]|nr:hypothetical protein [Planctomycetota bacterium]